VDLRQLQYFVAVARRRHFTRAAEDLYVTQSALSQQVRRLEDELGLALLRRTSQGVELTPAGAELLERADAVLGELARARAAMDRHAGVARGAVRVAAVAADAPRLPEALAAFHAEHPGVQVALRHGSAGEVVDLAARGAVDLAVVAARGSAPSGLAATPLAEEPLRIVLAPGDALAGPGAVALADLRGRAFVLAEPGTALRDAVMAACQAVGFSPVPLFEVSDPATVRTLARAGLGVALVPASWLEGPGPEVGTADLAPPVPRHRAALLAPVAGGSPAARLLHAALAARLGPGAEA
jgi:DNA-binding transcriptional LysR family regulator